MIKKFLSKYILEVIPSVLATVVGAYIVTHYINAKPEADKPKTSISSPAETSKSAVPQTLKADEAPQESPKAEAARLKAEKLAAEKAAAERSAADRAENVRRAAEKLATEKAIAEKAAAEKLASEKAAAEKRERERTVAKAAPVAPPASDANPAPDRDANDLARAAIDRLRKTNPQAAEQPRAPDAARTEEATKPQPERAKVNSVVYAPAPSTSQPPVQPLPPAVNVAPPPAEVAITPPPAPFPRPVDETRDDDASRPTPPANIPSRPLDLRAHERDRSVAEGVVSAARSVFQAVIPQSSN